MTHFFKKLLQAIATLTWGLKQLFLAGPLEATILLVFVIFQGLIPAASLYAIQGIIQWISSPSSFPLLFVGLWGGMLLADVILSPVISVVRLHLNEKILTHCNLLLMEKANTIQSLAPFETPKLYDEIQFLKNESAKRPLNFVYVLTGFVKDGVAVLSVLAVLSLLGWWIPLAMLFTNLPHALSTLWFEKQSWDQILFRSPDSRKMAWVSSLTLDDRVAKEVRLFGFGNFLVEKYKLIFKNMHQNFSKERWKKATFAVFLSSVTVVGNIVLISIVLLRAKEGFLQIGSLVIAIQALVMTQSQLTGCISYIGMTTPIFLFFERLKAFLLSSICAFSKNSESYKPDHFNEIRFENVTFIYPDGRKALSNVSFTLRKGQKIAIVGENGAGKSTIIKLLLRFYDPTEGAILIDGRDLKSLDLSLWRSFISGVFQDFGQYHLTVKENIFLGDVQASESQVSHAAKKGGFASTLNRLPIGLNTLLGKEFGGTSLSGGEWQKLAMSRAFLREAKLFIFDEPTSALDPESEQEVYRRFAEQSQGKTTLLITHRLGSVKMTDYILVFKSGRLIEEGSHLDLLSIEGEYKTLFQIQASQYVSRKQDIAQSTAFLYQKSMD